MTSPIRVVVIGAHPVLQLGLTTAIQADRRLVLVADLPDIAEAAASLRELSADVLIVYTAVPHRSVAKVMECLPAEAADTPVLLLTTSSASAEMLVCLRAVVRGYAVLTHLSLDELSAGIVTLVTHGEWLCPLTLHHLMTFVIQHAAGAAGHLATTNRVLLSEREVEVLRMTAAGAGEKEIAAALAISPNTVKTYLHRICQKMNVPSRAAAIRRALMLNLIPDRRARLA